MQSQLIDQHGGQIMNTTAIRDNLADRGVQMRTLVACAAGVCIANVAWWIQPQLIFQLGATGRLSESQAGLVASVELGALALSSVLLSRILRRSSLRSIALIGAAVAIIATILSIIVTSYPQLLLARTFVGFGEGAVFMVANIAAARFPDPDRAYGKINFVNVILGVALVAATPAFSGTLGQTAALPALLVSLVILAPFLFFMPNFLRIERKMSLSATPTGPAKAVRSRPIVLANLTFSFFLAAIMSAAIWAFYGVIGTRAGMTDSQVNSAIAVAVMGALLGGAVAPLVGTSLGRLAPVTLGIVLLASSMLALCLIRNPYVFRIATFFNVGANYIILPYYMGAAAEEDPSGRGVAIIGGTFLLVGAIGPYLGGMLMETVGLRTIALFVFITCAMAWVSFLIVNVELKRQAKRRTLVVGSEATGVIG